MGELRQMIVNQQEKQAKQATLIELTNAGLYRDGRWLVRNIDLTVGAGEIVTLVGPNGSGKSTTVKMALGIESPNEGRLQQAKDLVVGYIPQKMNIDWTMPLSVRRFMELTSRLTEAQIDTALEQTGATALKFAELRNLSGGEFQRVMLSRVIARKPELLVLDEPVQGLDFSGEIEIYELIGRIRDQLECGILLISHDLHLVMAKTDRVICLNGHVCCSGTPKAVSESPEYQNLFGTHLNSAHAVYEHHHDHTHLPDGRVRHSDGTITQHCHPDDGHHHGDHEPNDQKHGDHENCGGNHAG